jgi:tetratricopeptide (TPR) repeat protein
MRVRSALVIFSLAAASSAACLFAQTTKPQPARLTSDTERAALHNSTEWQLMQPHLPDPQTANAASLEVAGDVLRARRFPEDALDYYGYAMARGGNVSELLNKMGITRLELRQNDLARQMFLRTVRAKKNDAQAWNNLGVTEYSDHNYIAAIYDYKRANKLNRGSAVFHSNLAMAYFEASDMLNARRQFALAIQLDPRIMQERDSGGVTAHIVGSHNYPEMCFEMARLYALNHDPQATRLWLAKALEGGYDVRTGMSDDTVFRHYIKDPEVVMMLTNASQMRKRSVAAAPGLGESVPSPAPAPGQPLLIN